MENKSEGNQFNEVSFKPEVRKKLENDGISIFSLRGLVFSQIGSQRDKFAEIIETISRDFPDLKNLTSKKIEVGIDLKNPYRRIEFLESGRGIVDEYKSFSETTAVRFPGTCTIVGEAVDYADLNDQASRDLFEDLKFTYHVLGQEFVTRAFRQIGQGRETRKSDWQIDKDYFRKTGIVINVESKIARVGYFNSSGDSGSLKSPEPYSVDFIAPLIIPASP